MSASSYFLGLSLGQPHEFTALAVLESSRDAENIVQYAVRHLQRFPVGTPFAAIAEAVAALTRDANLNHPAVLADLTGIGGSILKLLRRSDIHGWIVPVTITIGRMVARDADGMHMVPKQDLVGCLQLLLQGRRLKVAKGLPDADLLSREMQNFRMKSVPLTGNDPMIAWREGQHDDLVQAVASACWWAERHPPSDPDVWMTEPTETQQLIERLFPAGNSW